MTPFVNFSQTLLTTSYFFINLVQLFFNQNDFVLFISACTLGLVEHHCFPEDFLKMIVQADKSLPFFSFLSYKINKSIWLT